MDKKKRLLLKISGEALAGDKKMGVDNTILKRIAEQIKLAVNEGYQIAIVVGGGNYWRGRSNEMFDNTKSDYIGMLATTMNALIISDMLESIGVPSRVQTAVEMIKFAEPYITRKAVAHLEEGKVVIFGCGTGNPCFSTDTAAALRAIEIKADMILKATMVDGVYDKDPNKYSDAVKFDEITFKDILSKNLKVIDSTAAALCQENHMPLLVFDISDESNIYKAIKSGEKIGTKVIF